MRMFDCPAWAVSVVGFAVTAYATCCRYTVSWPASTPCAGATAEVCEESTVSCTSAPGLDWSCLKNVGIKEAVCTTYTLGDDGAWGHFACDYTPPAGWTFVAKLSDGSCCWIKSPSGTDVKPREALFVNTCAIEACASGGGEQ